MRLEILLSTYNGERYLPELLASLDGQTFHDFRLHARDDGSVDRTVEILDEYARRHPASVAHGGHLGVPASFFHLLHDASSEAEFYAFCDQDDVWLPGKLARAVNFLSGTDPVLPALYCSALTPVNAALEPLILLSRPLRALDFRNALVENCVSGCTVVMNRAARVLLTRSMPRAALMHDQWAYLVVSAFGRLHWDPEPGLLYRQHGHNTVGMPRGWWSRVRGFRRRRGMSPMFAQAEEFRAVYGALLDPARGAILDRFLGSRLNLSSRLGYALRAATFRQSPVDDLAHRAMIALGYF
ncbi:MAG TPA: glycosyltransferase family 2 protein [Longimicrobium sp.]|nr:glycosyltransferase family 2 protein [Longimicrobium sp.]